MERKQNQTISAEGSYEVFCLNCGKVYDACQSLWCECITDNPTLECPHCHKCFCNTGAEARKGILGGRPHRALAAPTSELLPGDGSAPNGYRQPYPGGPSYCLRMTNRTPGALRSVSSRDWDMGSSWPKDGVEALELARIYQPDLILTDNMMPHGWQAPL